MNLTDYSSLLQRPCFRTLCFLRLGRCKPKRLLSHSTKVLRLLSRREIHLSLPVAVFRQQVKIFFLHSHNYSSFLISVLCFVCILTLLCILALFFKTLKHCFYEISLGEGFILMVL